MVVLVLAAAPLVADGIERIERFREDARAEGCFHPVDPIYTWFRDEVTSPVVVLASDLQAVRIPAYSSETNVVSRRGPAPQRGGSRDGPVRLPLSEKLENLPGFEPVDQPSERYDLFEVDLRRLGESPGSGDARPFL